MQGYVSTKKSPLKSKQGYDLAFATNYLGHFLLTDLLLPTLKRTKQAKILQVSSNSQFMVTGKELDTSGGRQPPIAAQVLQPYDHNEWGTETLAWYKSIYGTTKLAQIMHSIELQKVLDADSTTDLKVCTRHNVI
jgi:NAD(P)-dependent dehydrogenase (short-subunit alcohol dehydrogenase family)